MIRIPIIAALFWLLGLVQLQAETLRLAVTTSFHNSGLAAVLLPAIKADLGINVEVLVVGTGQAIRLGEVGDVDAILVHAPKVEAAMVAAGYASHRRQIMYNDFVLIGPDHDPAGIADAASAVAALSAIKASGIASGAGFVRRGDDSGTHKKELTLWASAGIAITSREMSWYKSVGAGMGTALNIAAGKNAYVLSDRASWLTFLNKQDLALLFAGDPALFNQYSYLPVNPARHSHIRADLAQDLEDWLVSARARDLINGYQLNGEALFVFNATGD